ncbi:MAG: hypothetical protein WCY49_01300 [Anaerovoracaceae bacterium]|nr:hypothetical protein [Clostridiales bacterium]
MNRKIISCLLSLVLLLTMGFLSGCGESPETIVEEGTSLDLVVSYINAMENEDFEAIEKMMAEDSDVGEVYLSKYSKAPKTLVEMIASQYEFITHFYGEDGFEKMVYHFMENPVDNTTTRVEFYFPEQPVHLLGYKDFHMVLKEEEGKWSIIKGLTWIQDQYSDFPRPDYYKAVEASYGVINMTSTAQDVINAFGEPLKTDIPQISTGEEEFREYYMEYEWNTYYFVPGGDFVPTIDRYIISSINVADSAKAMNRDIRIGDTFYDVMKKYPIDKDWLTDPNNCFYGENTYDSFGGACFTYEEGGKVYDTVALVPLEYTPYIKYEFIDKVMVSAMIVFISLF